VGLTSCLPAVYRAVEAAIGLPADTRLDGLVSRPNGPSLRTPARLWRAWEAERNVSSCWSKRPLPPAVQKEMLAVAEPDRRLYLAASQRLLPGCTAEMKAVQTSAAQDPREILFSPQRASASASLATARSCGEPAAAAAIVREWEAARNMSGAQLEAAYGPMVNEWMLWLSDRTLERLAKQQRASPTAPVDAAFLDALKK